MQLRKLWHRHGNGFHCLATLAMSPLVRSDGVRKRSEKERNEIERREKEAKIKQDIVDEFSEMQIDFVQLKKYIVKKISLKFSLKQK